MSFVDLLQAETERLGFPIYGVARVAAPPHYAVYQRWIEAGRHAEMAYLAAERALQRRADPGLIQPGARYVLVVGMRYASPAGNSDGPADEALGRVAAYAWGEDYHDVIPPRLEAIAAAVERYFGKVLERRSYTDTGPVLERDMAQKAGLGWAGKNTCLISPHSGSYYLLGEMFIGAAVDEAVQPAAPFTADHCGTCTRCIDACPTGAIRLDRTLESARCISYQTIENKGSIPIEMRSSMGEWVFGCDICQMVCPWNLRFSPPEGHPALAPRPGIARPVLRHELRLSPEEFNRKFRRSPILRAKRRGYLRNVAVALGNAGDNAAAPELARILENEPEPLVRAHAAWALGQMHGEAARKSLEKARRQETDAQVTVEIQTALDK